MNELQSRLAALRRRMRLVVTRHGLTILLAMVLGCAILAGLLDWRLHLPSLVRALLLVGILGGAGYLAYRHLLTPLWGKTDDLSLALRVEEHYPILNDGLASTVQFLEQPEQGETSGSPALRREAIQRSLRLAQGCDFNEVIERRGSGWAAGGAFLAVAVAVLLFLLAPGLAWTGLWRLLEPFGNHSWTRLDIENSGKQPQRVALGKPYVIKGQVTGIIPANAKIELENRSPDEPKGFRKREKMVVPITNGKLEVPLPHGQPLRFRQRDPPVTRRCLIVVVILGADPQQICGRRDLRRGDRAGRQLIVGSRTAGRAGPDVNPLHVHVQIAFREPRERFPLVERIECAGRLNIGQDQARFDERRIHRNE